MSVLLGQEDGILRLFGGDDERDGRLEIVYNGRWGVICSEFWSISDGVVACNQLGFGGDSVSIPDL